jgi:hypothetical protein
MILSAITKLDSFATCSVQSRTLDGVDAQLEALDCLAAYGRFRLSAEGPSRRDTIAAEPVDRDWLLTSSPHEP